MSLIDCLVFKQRKTIWVWETLRKNDPLTRKFIKNHHIVMTSLIPRLPNPKTYGIYSPRLPLTKDFIKEWPLKLNDRGQDLTGTISLTNLPLKKQIHQFMFHSINIGISTLISAGQKNDSLTILLKIKFLEMLVRSKKGKLTSNRSLPESLPPTEVSASQHSLRVYLQITYWKITRYNKKCDWMGL